MQFFFYTLDVSKMQPVLSKIETFSSLQRLSLPLQPLVCYQRGTSSLSLSLSPLSLSLSLCVCLQERVLHSLLVCLLPSATLLLHQTTFRRLFIFYFLLCLLAPVLPYSPSAFSHYTALFLVSVCRLRVLGRHRFVQAEITDTRTGVLVVSASSFLRWINCPNGLSVTPLVLVSWPWRGPVKSSKQKPTRLKSKNLERTLL